MDLSATYKEYRKRQVQLHSDILNQCVNQVDFEKAIELLGVKQNNEIVLEHEYEKDVILDFAIYENIKKGKNAVMEFIEQNEKISRQEEELLAAMKASNPSLYEVEQIIPENNMIWLKDIFNNTEPFKVIDIGLSKSVKENSLVFTRFLHLRNFSMTSGLGFYFTANHKQYLIKRSKKLAKRINSGNTSIDRFIAFFNLNRSDGLASVFEHVK
ncbi:hypothetical protein J8TS2_14260 [Lederbergia ruris]|uniref:Uncharacterized protein n=1 Tax=Lederbergia ruris TaxID=217495 RepID=A0ABQ4KIH3_9BACI|nr:hypothetical protein [Lederbergia ruris]GIN57107.1 hypothetical protein J8TS2_14260 [Lederbergia ruris]